MRHKGVLHCAYLVFTVEPITKDEVVDHTQGFDLPTSHISGSHCYVRLYT